MYIYIYVYILTYHQIQRIYEYLSEFMMNSLLVTSFLKICRKSAVAQLPKGQWEQLRRRSCAAMRRAGGGQQKSLQYTNYLAEA